MPLVHIIIMASSTISEQTPLLLKRKKVKLTEKRRRTCFVISFCVLLVAVVLLSTKSCSTPQENESPQLLVDQVLSAFPDDFIWGAATSAYQIEGGATDGGRGPSIWDSWCLQSINNCNGDTGNTTDDHFHLWQEDIELMQRLGLKAYRFSISWSRILPTGKAEGTESGDHRYSKTEGINYEGIQFYNNIIDRLIAKGIEPFITLYHWDLPQSLQDDYGGWENEKIIKDFANYARICFQFFGDRVKYWITINEGWSVAIGGYEQGTKAPGFISEARGGSGKPYLVAHHLLLAHAQAVFIYRNEGYSRWYFHGNSNITGIIGISNCGDYRFPLDSLSQADEEAANRAMEFQIGWLVSLLIFPWSIVVFDYIFHYIYYN